MSPGPATITATSERKSDTATVVVTPGPAVRLVFSTQPATATAGATISPAVLVTAQDAHGYTATGFTGNVTVAIGTNPAGGTLSGTTTLAADSGVATFSDLGIDKSGTGYTLQASASSLVGDASAAFTVSAGPATQLAFTTQPTTTGAGRAITPALTVIALDHLGNTATAFTADITISLGNNPGGAALSGTTTVAAVAGIATFANLRLNRTGTGYALVASASGLTADTSVAFDVIPVPAERLVFMLEPTTTTAGSPMTPAVVVAGQDTLGNTVSSFTGNVTVTLGANPNGATLSGTTTVAAVGGIATFTNLRLDKSDAGYTLVASATLVAPDTSAAFAVIAGPAVQLVFTTQPTAPSAGSPITPAIAVTAQDALGNTATSFTGSITIALGGNTVGATLSGTMTVPAVGGVASFGDLWLDKSGTGFTLVATAAGGGLTAATSAAFDVASAAAARLVFTTQPTSTSAGSPIFPAVVATVQDSLGNTVTSFNGTVTIALGSNPAGGTLSATNPVAAVNGVATFTDLHVDKVGAAYTLVVTGTALTGAISATFNVTPGEAAVLAFTVQPSISVAGEVIAPAVQVTARDDFGNPVDSFTGSVTVALGSSPDGAILNGTQTVAALAGVATFSDLTLAKAGTGYALVASATSLTDATSASFSVTAAGAAGLAFTVQPSSTEAGGVIEPAVQVTARDSFGNAAPSFTGSVTVALGANPGSGTLRGTTTVVAIGGIATFADLSLDKVGAGYTLAASALGLTPDTSSGFQVFAAAAARFVFTTQPTTTSAGSPISPAVVVTARDALGNDATSFTGNVTIALGTNPGTATLAGTTTGAAVAGVATFADLNLDKVGTGYTLVASAATVAPETSTPFVVVAGPAARLSFTTQPTSVVAGDPFAPAVAVTVLDHFGNTATEFAGDVTISLGNNPGGAALSGTTAVAPVVGVAAFADLSLNRTGTAYSLVASAPGVPGATSAVFDIVPAPAMQLVFTTQPTSTLAGSVITPAVTVTAQDALGNTATDFTGNVTVALGTNPGGDALSGTTTVPAVGGVATFANLGLERAETGYTLVASAAAVSPGTSTAFDVIAGPAVQLAFTTQPTTTSAGSPITPAVVATARDALGNTAISFTGNVTIALGANPPSGTLSGTTSKAAENGVASFNDLRLDKAGTGYTLVATAAGGGLTAATSTAFDVASAAASRLVFTTQPTNTTAGNTITPHVVVTAEDSLGNTVTSFTGNVTVALGSNPGGSSLGGTKTRAAVAGVATFSNLTLDKVGTGYTLAASAASLTGAISGSFNVTAAGAAVLAFTVQPSTTVAGAVITPEVQVTARDNFGNTAPFTGNVTIALGNNPSGATLGGTLTVAAVAGVASFTNLTLVKAGTGYTLAASAPSLTGATSGSFSITAAGATTLAFTVQPSNAVAGAAITPAVRVTALDGFGNVATSFSGNVAIALGNNPGGATLGGTATRAAVAGVATFSNLTLDKVGTGYDLAASAAGLGGATSASFNITAASATSLAFTTQPSSAVAGTVITPAVQVTARDNFGNTATSFTGNVTVALGNNPGSSTLGGTRTVAAVAGVATFATLTLNKTGTGYTLAASASGLTGATSAGFNITPASATTLAYTVQPSTTVAGAAIAPAVQVTARDNFGNTAPSFAGNVTIALGSNPGGAVLGGTRTIAALNGVATFADLTLNKTGSGYTLVSSATGLSGATSGSFNVNAAAATTLAFTVQPVNTVAGATITPSVKVAARDNYGNTVTSFTSNITIALVNNPGNATLGGTKTRAAVAGVATFTGLTLDKVGTGYELAATSGSLTGATSAGFNITPGSAATLVFTVPPGTTVAGAAITPAVKVTARDNFGNTATAFTGNVTIALGNNPGSATLGGTKTIAAVAGVATFATLTLNRAGIGYTLTVTASGLSGATSSGFDVTAGPAAQLAFTTQPTSEPAGSPITPAVVVTARDALGNTATSFTGSITIALGNNPAGATLSGTRSAAAVNGVASFADLRVDRTGTGYTLVATAAGLAAATSAAFNVVAAIAERLVFTTQPTNTTAGNAIAPAVAVTARDSLGNTVTTFTGNVTISLGTNPSGATLTGTNPVAAVNGVATFANLRVDKVGSGYTLVATAAALTGATSGTFNVTAGSVAGLAFTVQPSTAVAGASITPAVQVAARDNLGNPVTSFTGNVTVALGNNPGGATLGGTKTRAAVAGVATFTGLTLNKVGTGYTLTASASGLAGATSAAFNINSASATTLAFTTQPISAVVGTAITPPVRVTARDNFGNTAASFTGNVTIALANNPNSATLNGTKTVAAVAGVATFSTLSLNKTGTGYTLRATASGLTSATSNAFNVTATGAAVVLVGAGDIADCSANEEATAALLDNIAGTVFTAGDNAYPDGSAADYAQCYEPTWGRHKARTRPSPGNHEYHTSGAADYFSYFGANAGPAGVGYYSYDLGNWHIISLNSNISMSAGSTQEQWLRADLAASTKQCTLAYWHHPRFSSGSHGSSTASQPLWQALYDANADVIVVGHDHNYQRFAPMTPSGTLDLTRGIRQFVAGMGGRSHYSFSTPIANTEAYDTSTYGVLKFTLAAGSYTWEFIPVAGQTYSDSGSGTCH